MPSLKQSPTTRLKYGSNRGEAELREALAFLFLVKGAGRRTIPSVDEFFAYCRIINEQLISKKHSKKQSSIRAFVAFLIPGLKAKDSLDSLFQIISVVENALMLHAYIKRHVELAAEGFWPCAKTLHKAVIKSVISEYNFHLPIFWFFRNIVTLFGNTVTELVVQYNKKILMELIAPTLLTNPLVLASLTIHSIDVVTANVEAMRDDYYIPIANTLKKLGFFDLF